MKKSELREIIREMIIEESVDPILDKIGKIAKDVDMMSMRTPLEKLFNKKDIDFVMNPIAHFRIKHKGRIILIVNKKYVDKPELVVGSYAIGYE